MKKMYVYIKLSIAKRYVSFEQPLSEEEYNNIGSTWDDYLADKWVPLSEQQAAYHNAHPEAGVKEVWDMAPAPPAPRTLDDAKREKIAEIEAYDESDAVNGFDVEFVGEIITTWITPDKRSNYKNSVDAAELIGMETVNPILNGLQISIPTQMAKMALAQIQIYADRCYIVTEQHKAQVMALESIDDVDAFDITAGYPEKLTFNL